jgi:hypothetical protein
MGVPPGVKNPNNVKKIATNAHPGVAIHQLLDGCRPCLQDGAREIRIAYRNRAPARAAHRAQLARKSQRGARYGRRT